MVLQSYFADIVLDYFNSNAGPYSEAYGFYDPDGSGGGEDVIGVFGQQAIDTVRGADPDPAVDALSLPTGSYVTVGFTQGYITDGPGNDIFIRESGAAGDQADVYVSSLSNPTAADFIYLGHATDETITSFDLAAIGFTQPVRSVKIVGLDNNGGSPGFDVASVQALQVQTAAGGLILTGDDNPNLLVGANGSDFLTGKGGSDTILGNGGNDDLLGGDDNDRLRDGKGNDRMKGGFGSDRLFCGKGKDTVILDIQERNFFDLDIVKGFKAGQDKFGIAAGQNIRRGQIDFEQRGSNTIVSYLGTEIAKLKGVQSDELGRSDIKFIAATDAILG